MKTENDAYEMLRSLIVNRKLDADEQDRIYQIEKKLKMELKQKFSEDHKSHKITENKKVDINQTQVNKIENFKYSPKALYENARVLVLSGENDKAIDLLRIALSIKPSINDWLKRDIDFQFIKKYLKFKELKLHSK